MVRPTCLALAILAVAAPAASAAVTSTYNLGLLTVNSDSAGDSITIACGAGVLVNNAAVSGSSCSGTTQIVVNGNGGGDLIDLQAVNSSTFANLSSTTLSGGAGTDNIIGSQRLDIIDGGADADFIDGNSGNDTISTNDTAGDTDFSGGIGTDRLVVSGDLSDGVVVGSSSITTNTATVPHTGFEAATFNPPLGEPTLDLTDAPWPVTVNGNTGNETVWTGPFNDILNLGTQGIADTVRARTDAPSIFITAGGISGTGVGNDSWSGVERAELISPSALGVPGAPVVGSVWDASLANRPVVMRGGTGNDTMIGGGFADQLGSDVGNLDEETGDDTFDGGGGTDTIRPGPGTDTLRKTAVNANATATATALTSDGEVDNFTAGALEIVSLTGNGNANVLNTSAFGGRAVLNGGGGVDTLTGSAQNDQLTGGAADDSFTGGGGTDTLAETAGVASVATLTPTSLTGFGGTEDLSGIERAELTGSSGIDVFDASAFTGPVVLTGNGGADSLTGGLGPDTLLGGAGIDTLNAQDATADTTIDCGSEADTANVDYLDPASIGCETINSTSAPSPDPGPGGGDPAQNPDPGTTAGSSSGTTAIPDPRVSDSRAPALAIRAGRVDSRGRAPIRFTCPPDETTCTGTFQLRAKLGKKTVIVGRGKFTVAGGKVVAARVRLNAAARRLLRQRGRLKVTVVGSATDAAGNAAGLKKALTLKPAPRKRR